MKNAFWFGGLLLERRHSLADIIKDRGFGIVVAKQQEADSKYKTFCLLLSDHVDMTSTVDIILAIM